MPIEKFILYFVFQVRYPSLSAGKLVFSGWDGEGGYSVAMTWYSRSGTHHWGFLLVALLRLMEPWLEK